MSQAAQDLRRLIMRLAALTEAKIQAAIARDSDRLLNLLQEEMDPLAEVQRILYSFPPLSPGERAELRDLIEAWMGRTTYLGTLLETQLGYIDFARAVLGIDRTGGLDTSW
ncbi:conserved protein of unknown function [Candidatus Hydrogenisulfobacillus filiaventi]|uniref:Uncharacterized protein n=1 Tax=Candidatus Hydrogenisulfobacillus filiaventi TaxID=2707344 RepID=A0A6F8ZF07_9FIRM|nr:hypothetical protein [Bacillota bacterium]CAB1128042.1 conserved protein of unknown function [Candidatus Hydrogenisulfobacillus filiaventi]